MTEYKQSKDTSDQLHKIEEGAALTGASHQEDAVAESVEDVKDDVHSEDTLRGEVKELVGGDLSPEEYEELESVIYSISSGKVLIQSK